MLEQSRFEGYKRFGIDYPPILDTFLQETNTNKYQALINATAYYHKSIKGNITIIAQSVDNKDDIPEMLANLGISLINDFGENVFFKNTALMRDAVKELKDYAHYYCDAAYNMVIDEYLEYTSTPLVREKPVYKGSDDIVNSISPGKMEYNSGIWIPIKDVTIGSGVKVPNRMIEFNKPSHAAQYYIETMISNIGPGTAKVTPQDMYKYREACILDDKCPLNRIEMKAKYLIRHLKEWGYNP